MNASLSLEKRTIRKVTLRIIPYMFIAYLVSFLDRVSVSYAAIGGMDKALNLTSTAFGLISGIFFLGYFLCEAPSNVFMYKIGPRKWIGRILITWGAVTIVTAFASTATHLYIFRFLLGVAEAGFFPGMILYITYWFRAKERAKAVALFMIAPPIANVVGAPLSNWIVDNIHGLGMPGWRWIFVITGIPAILLGLVTFFYLTDRPENAKWLSTEEKDWLAGELKKEQEAKLTSKKYSIKNVLKDSKVWRFALINFTYVVGLYGLNFWMPQIIKSLSKLFSNTQVSMITMIPYLIGAIAMVIMARHSDRTGERKYHAAIAPIIGSLGLLGMLVSPNAFTSIIMISLATAGLYSFSGPYWALTTSFFTAEAAALGIGIINSIGNLGGFFGPYVIGMLNDKTGTVTFGLGFVSLILFVTAVQVIFIKKRKAEPQAGQIPFPHKNVQ